jgi:hypothetical protein
MRLVLGLHMVENDQPAVLNSRCTPVTKNVPVQRMFVTHEAILIPDTTKRVFESESHAESIARIEIVQMPKT